MKLYIVRHGQTDCNARRIHQTSEDPLNEKGFEQAKALAERFRTIKVDIIYSSPFIRTAKTAEELHKITKKDVTYVDEIREAKRPSEIEGLSVDAEKVVEIKKILNDHFHDKDFHYSDEENYYDFRTRCLNGLEKIIKEHEYDHVVVVTHGMVMRMFIALMMFGKEVTSHEFKYLYKFLETKNTGITVCDYKDEKWHLLTWNDHAHLG